MSILISRSCKILGRFTVFRMKSGFTDILAMPADMRYTINRQNDVDVPFGTAKSPGVAPPGLFLSFWSRQIEPEDGYQLTFCPSICKCSALLHSPRQRGRTTSILPSETPPSSTCMGVVACTVYHECRMTARNVEYSCNDCCCAVYFDKK